MALHDALSEKSEHTLREAQAVPYWYLLDYMQQCLDAGASETCRQLLNQLKSNKFLVEHATRVWRAAGDPSADRLVTISEIAAGLGKSKRTVQLLLRRIRRAGKLPQPILPARGQNAALFRLSEILPVVNLFQGTVVSL